MPSPAPSCPTQARRIRVRGVVQGVGFRPTVWRLARRLGLTGWVCNDGEGVLIEAWGDAGQHAALLDLLRLEAPPLARIEAIEWHHLGVAGTMPADFRIDHSRQGMVQTQVAPDSATCPACLAEIRDPADRRYRYPFTNCTHCGPRLTIIRTLPYDRRHTSMARFPMCPACEAEYLDPADRRFHAQPNACPACGPRLWLETTSGELSCGDPLDRAVELLRAGRILGIKGLGGFHLVADATDVAVIERLRQRKRRPHKPLALMARDTAVVARYCHLDPLERSALESTAAPVVVLQARDRVALPEAIAPGQHTLGFMLPHTPLHHLLLERFDQPLVFTSGNHSGHPPCTGNDEARHRLFSVADALLLHDRDIVNRLDDSVVRLMDSAIRPLRRARGQAPVPLTLPEGFEEADEILALGGELKNTFCLVRSGQAILSQHNGDLENAATLAEYKRTLALYEQLYQAAPRLLAVDAHPDYLSSKLGQDRTRREGLQLVEVQHHHAHLAACLAENGLPRAAGPVLGLALDGLGLGDDGTLWGGELMLADYCGYRRLAHLAPAPLPGGARAIVEPWRNLWAQLRQHLGDTLPPSHGDVPALRRLASMPLATLEGMLRNGINTPWSSSCGRLFDAAAAALGLCFEAQSYEGQAASTLEAMATQCDAMPASGYPLATISTGACTRLDPAPLWRAMLADLAGGVEAPVIARRFHEGLAAAWCRLMLHYAGQTGARQVALSGGVFQNRLLAESIGQRLRQHGLEVFTHRRVPANDGGLALGQAAVAAARLLATRR